MTDLSPEERQKILDKYPKMTWEEFLQIPLRCDCNTRKEYMQRFDKEELYPDLNIVLISVKGGCEINFVHVI